MARAVSFTVLAALVSLASSPAFAETAPHRARKPVHAAKTMPPTPSTSRNINAPSTDFSTVERADGDSDGPDRGGLRPALGAGGIGIGGGF